MNLRIKRQRAALTGIFHSESPSRSLWRTKFDAGVCPGIASVFVEYEIARLQMDRVLQRFWCGLVGARQSSGIRDQIDLDVAHGGDIARLLVVGKIVAVNLVEARRVAAIKHNRNVVKLGIAVQLELFHIAGLDREERALAVGLGKLETVRGLLDVVTDLA